MAKKTKLIRKTTKTFLIIGLILALLSSVFIYFYTQQLLEKEVEEVLYSTEVRVLDALEKTGEPYSLTPVIEVAKVVDLREAYIKDTVIYDPSENEMELFRELSTFKTVNGENYQITVRNMVVESEDFLIAIVITNSLIFVLAFIFLFYFNTKRNLELWSPFFKNLEQMKQFSIMSKESLELVDSDVLEFSELKNEISILIGKVKTDYENLKQFTEDVSHEIQTPLAIIQAKIDNIINAHEINDKQFEQITSIQRDIQRLKQLNKRVTTLTKIDNNQYDNIENVSLTQLIEAKIESFKELTPVVFTNRSEQELSVSMDPYLADVLLNNLLSNAIKYNTNGNPIIIVSSYNALVVSNFGQKELSKPDKLFKRFYRESHGNQSTGLGLAIVKKICDLYDYKISYTYTKNHHVFSIKF